MEAEFEAEENSEKLSESVLPPAFVSAGEEELGGEDMPVADSEIGINGLLPQNLVAHNETCFECNGLGCTLCPISQDSDMVKKLTVPEEAASYNSLHLQSGSVARK